MLDGARGFMFDVDGTLVHRGGDGRAEPQPDAVEVLERIRNSGRPLVLFTNGSHVPSAAIASGLRDDGLPIADQEMLTPTDSAVSYLRRRHPGQPVLLFASPAITEWMAAAGVNVTEGEDAEAVFVAHLDHIEVPRLERAARAVLRGAPLLTSSYARGYAGANGIIFSRGAMITAAIAKVTGARPKVLGKPSRAAVRELSERLRAPADQLVVIGDDLGMDIALGRLGGSRTILVRSGISGQIDLDRVPERRRPDAAIDRVGDLLQWL
ncbi:MAG TPA: HAD hydrolase-like protein [Solirubrobacteraceae bacterium]|nr:HAD hydrolase-like protein [Solirubrobacteraceae bacterium]